MPAGAGDGGYPAMQTESCSVKTGPLDIHADEKPVYNDLSLEPVLYTCTVFIYMHSFNPLHF